MGSSIAARRSLSAISGVLAIAAAVWIGIEVDSLLAGFAIGALVAVSPFAIAYAQVAREYALWLALTFAATALFARALRTRRLAPWVAYAVCLIAGSYTAVLFAIVIVAHAIALPFVAKRTRAPYLRFGAVLIALAIAYAPWIAALVVGLRHGFVTNNAYLSAGIPLKFFALKWIFNVGTLFYDGDYVWPKTAVAFLPGVVALGSAFVWGARSVRKRGELVVFITLASVSIVGLVVPDLLHHQQRSTSSRYLVPLWVACYSLLGIAVANLARSERRALRPLALAFVALCAITGSISFAISTKHETWWVDGSTSPIGPIARAIDRARNPLVLYRARWASASPGPWDFSVVMLADIVRPTTSIEQGRGDDTLRVPMWNGDIFLLDPSDETLAKLRGRASFPTLVAGGISTHVDAQIAALRATTAKEAARHGDDAFVPKLWAIGNGPYSIGPRTTAAATPTR